MSNVYLQDSTLTAIGDAIREKGGTSDLLLPSEMAPAILNLSTGGSSSSGGINLSDIKIKAGSVPSASQYIAWTNWQKYFTREMIENNKVILLGFLYYGGNYSGVILWNPIEGTYSWTDDSTGVLSNCREGIYISGRIYGREPGGYRTHSDGTTSGSIWPTFQITLASTGLQVQYATSTATSLSTMTLGATNTGSSTGYRDTYGFVLYTD